VPNSDDALALPVTANLDASNVVGLPAAQAATQLFISDYQEHARFAWEEARRQAAALRRREDLLFMTSIATVGLGLALIATGAGLVFLGLTPLGALSGVIGVLSGAGTAVLREATSRTARQRAEADNRAIEEGRRLQTIGFHLMITDERARTRAMVKLASRLTATIEPPALMKLPTAQASPRRPRRPRRPSVAGSGQP
jgi:hypothetical protein